MMQNVNQAFTNKTEPCWKRKAVFKFVGHLRETKSTKELQDVMFIWVQWHNGLRASSNSSRSLMFSGGWCETLIAGDLCSEWPCPLWSWPAEHRRCSLAPAGTHKFFNFSGNAVWHYKELDSRATEQPVKDIPVKPEDCGVTYSYWWLFSLWGQPGMI